MSAIRQPSGHLSLGGLDLSEVAQKVGSPVYVYDLDAMAKEARDLQEAFEDRPHLVAYAVKANTAGPVVRTMAEAGCGADVVSAGELSVAVACGVTPDRIVYNGVAKRDDEIDQALAAGPRGIAAVQLESVEEIGRVAARARALGRKARVSLRVNPSVDLKEATHAHIATGHDAAKFGVPLADIPRAVELVRSSPDLVLVGMAAHAGSQFRTLAPYLESAWVLLPLVRDLRASGVDTLAFVDTGGGFGVDYEAPPVGEAGPRQAIPKQADFVRAVRTVQRELGLDDLALFVEPGRSLVAAHGVLVARTIQTKISGTRRWLLIDAGMNDLLRPALYQAHHRIVPLDRAVDPAAAVTWRVAGPVCESSDDFGEHELPFDAPQQVAILDAGAYGYTMASVYNGRPLPAEVFVRDGRIASVTPRGSADAWVRGRVAGTA